MSYLHLTNTRTRTHDRSPSPYRSLVRHNTKRNVITIIDDEDDLHDDYPYSSSHGPLKPSRALTIRNQPSQLERYNVWSPRHTSEDREDECSRAREREHVYRHTTARRDSLVNDPEEQAFRLSVNAAFSRPHHHHHREDNVTGDVLRRKEKWVDEKWEVRERSRSRSRDGRDAFWGEGGFWGDRKEDSARESEDEKWSRYRRVKRTKTEEWRPLRGWRKV